MTKSHSNKRVIGGERAMAQFTIQMPKVDTFSEFRAKYSGMIVFNVRGACFFIKSGSASSVKSKIFPGGDSATIESFKLKDRGNTLCHFKNVRVKLLKEKDHGAACGVAVKFLQLTDAQMEQLNAARTDLPTAGSDSVILAALDKVAEFKKAG